MSTPWSWWMTSRNKYPKTPTKRPGVYRGSGTAELLHYICDSSEIIFRLKTSLWQWRHGEPSTFSRRAPPLLGDKRSVTKRHGRSGLQGSSTYRTRSMDGPGDSGNNLSSIVHLIQSLINNSLSRRICDHCPVTVYTGVNSINPVCVESTLAWRNGAKGIAEANVIYHPKILELLNCLDKILSDVNVRLSSTRFSATQEPNRNPTSIHASQL